MLLPNDLVQVRPPGEILATLDADGAMDGVVFMPEMLECVGSTYRIFRRLEKTCVEGYDGGVGQFSRNDVVFLQGLRCSGACHDDCGRSCLIFWKEAWLTRVDAASPPLETPPDSKALAALAARLHPIASGGVYFCQSTNLIKAIGHLSISGRLWKCVRDVRARTYTVPKMVQLIVKPVWAKFLLRFRTRYPVTDRTRTPSDSLGLVPGDLVEVKSVEEICATLDKHSNNRGLQWSYDLAPYSGRRFRVHKRLERIIVEHTSKMVRLNDTVLLEGARCPCKHVIGGCPRADYIYWREIWLRKIDEPVERAEQNALHPLKASRTASFPCSANRHTPA